MSIDCVRGRVTGWFVITIVVMVLMGDGDDIYEVMVMMMVLMIKVCLWLAIVLSVCLSGWVFSECLFG